MSFDQSHPFLLAPEFDLLTQTGWLPDPGAPLPLSSPHEGIGSPLDTDNFEAICEPGTSPLDFTAGTFTVGANGQIIVDYLVDGGGYAGEVALFSLRGMDALTGLDRRQEAVHRALSDSEWGRVVLSDREAGAQYDVILGESKSWNRGPYRGLQTFDFRPEDTLGMLIIPDGSVQEWVDRPCWNGKQAPLFSLATADPNDEFTGGQLVQLAPGSSVFSLEDLALSGKSDRDYNDLIFELTGVTAQVDTIDDWIDPANDWRDTPAGRELMDYATLLTEPTTGVKYRPHELLVKFPNGLTEDAIAGVMAPYGPTAITHLVPAAALSESPLQQWRWSALLQRWMS